MATFKERIQNECNFIDHLDLIRSSMAPVSTDMATHILSARAFNATSSVSQLRQTWVNPTGTISVLLILGGDVVQKALAQLVGGRLTPVSFSFGWVAYAVGAVVSAVGENKLMPPSPDCKAYVVNGNNGYVRENQSWILGRMMRDYEDWMDKNIKQALEDLLDKSHRDNIQKWEEEIKKPEKFSGRQSARPSRPSQAGICISIYDAGVDKQGHPIPPTPALGFFIYSGYAIMLLQLGIAAIPLGLSGDFAILMYTVAGNLLSLFTGTLKQWHREKWSCRQTEETSRKVTIVTRGNGAQHAIVIRNRGISFNLEDLATGARPSDAQMNRHTRVCIIALAALWIVLLISVSGQNTDQWYLMAIGAIGTLHNIYLAGWPCPPETYGIRLKYHDVITDTKVMPALYNLERVVPGAGRAMLSTFFPGELREDEERKWKEFKETAKDRARTVEESEKRANGSSSASSVQDVPKSAAA